MVTGRTIQTVAAHELVLELGDEGRGPYAENVCGSAVRDPETHPDLPVDAQTASATDSETTKGS